jgi:hypothetical protein
MNNTKTSAFLQSLIVHAVCVSPAIISGPAGFPVIVG